MASRSGKPPDPPDASSSAKKSSEDVDADMDDSDSEVEALSVMVVAEKKAAKEQEGIDSMIDPEYCFESVWISPSFNPAWWLQHCALQGLYSC